MVISYLDMVISYPDIVISYPDMVTSYLEIGISIIIYRLSDIYLIQIRKRLFGTIPDYY